MADTGMVLAPPILGPEQLDDLAELLAEGVTRGIIRQIAEAVMGVNALAEACNNIGDTRAFSRSIVKTLSDAGKIHEALALLTQDAPRSSRLMFWLNHVLSGRRLNDQKAMQAFVNEYEPFLNAAEFEQSLPRLMRTMCAVALGHPWNQVSGSGFLIDSDLIMTNYHVVKQLIRFDTGQPLAAAPGEKLFFFFDYLQPPFPGVPPTPQGHTCMVVNAAEDWLVYAREDLPYDGQREAPQDAGNRFDCAIIRLARPVGKSFTRKISGPRRGWLPLPKDDLDVFGAKRIMVFQHPGASHLQLDIGEYIDMDASKTRVRYTVSAAKGSSGGVAVDSSGRLFALHNAEVQDDKAPDGKPMNQGVRIDCIVRDLETAAPSVLNSVAPDDEKALFWSLNDDLNDPKPVIGRQEFREIVAKLSAPAPDKRVVVVNGPPAAGLNFSIPLLRRCVGAQTPVVVFRPPDLERLAPDDFLRVLVDELNVSGLAGNPIPALPSTENVPRWLRLDLPKWLFERLSEDHKRDNAKYPAWIVIDTVVPEGQRLLWKENLKDFVSALAGSHDPAQRSIELPQLRWLVLARRALPFTGLQHYSESLEETNTLARDFVECMQTAWLSIDKSADLLNENLLLMLAEEAMEGATDGVPVRKALANRVRRLIPKEGRK